MTIKTHFMRPIVGADLRVCPILQNQTYVSAQKNDHLKYNTIKHNTQ